MSRFSKRFLGAGMALCLMCAMFPAVGSWQSEEVQAADHGRLQNGALTSNADGWTISGELAEGTESYGYNFDSSYLSIWTNEGNTSEVGFEMSQVIENVEAGTYKAGAAVVTNDATDKPLTLSVETQSGTKQSIVLTSDGWSDSWQTENILHTPELEVAEGESVTITISGTFDQSDWYGVQNVAFTKQTGEAPEAPINLQKVEGLSEDFIHGVDVSSYLSLVQSGVKYYNEAGEEKNLFQILKDAGVNYVRLRVWNCPFPLDENGDFIYVEEDGVTEHTQSEIAQSRKNELGFWEYFLGNGTEVYRETYGAGICDVDTAAVIGKLATDYGMKVLIDFHYSDFWADPKKKSVPKEWENLSLADKADALSTFTTQSLQTIIGAGVDVGMVQIGNEINNGLSGETKNEDVYTLLKAGSAAVRSVDSGILIAVHFTDPQNDDYQIGRARELDAAGVDYDVFATSYYPFWHGSPEKLTADLKGIADTFHKKVMVAEVSYAWTMEDGDGYGNVVYPEAGDQVYDYPISVEGQATAIRNTIAAVAAVGENGIGTFYWEPAWVPVNPYDPQADNAAAVLAENEKAWKLNGAGWGSIYAKEYDVEIAQDERGGGTWDNQAYFDFTGKALPSINVYKWVYTGTKGPVNVLSVDEAVYEMQYKGEAQLPDTVNVNLNDGSQVPVKVQWNKEQTDALKTADYGEYTVEGSLAAFSFPSREETVEIAAGEYTTSCKVTITGTNYVQNGGFEEGSGEGWTLTNYAGTLEDGTEIGWPQVKKNSGNAKSGDYHYDAWWDGPMDFAIDQVIAEKIPAGTYMASAYYQGTGVVKLSEDAKLYVIVTMKDGTKKTYDTPVEIHNVWKDFYQAKVKDIVIDENAASVQIGTRIKVDESAAGGVGAWVVIDDISLMKTGDMKYQPTIGETVAPKDIVITLNGNVDALMDAVLTPEEKANSAIVPTSIYLKAADKMKDISEKEKDMIGKAAGDYKVGAYYDLILCKNIGGKETAVTDTNKKIAITLTLPEGLINKDAKVNRTYAVIRIHGEKAEVLPADYKDGKLTFESDKFSIYAVAYKDTPVENASQPQTTPSKNTGGAETGDNTPIAFSGLLLAAAAAVMAAGMMARRKKFI